MTRDNINKIQSIALCSCFLVLFFPPNKVSSKLITFGIKISTVCGLLFGGVISSWITLSRVIRPTLIPVSWLVRTVYSTHSRSWNLVLKWRPCCCFLWFDLIENKTKWKQWYRWCLFSNGLRLMSYSHVSLFY